MKNVMRGIVAVICISMICVTSAFSYVEMSDNFVIEEEKMSFQRTKENEVTMSAGSELQEEKHEVEPSSALSSEGDFVPGDIFIQFKTTKKDAVVKRSLSAKQKTKAIENFVTATGVELSIEELDLIISGEDSETYLVSFKEKSRQAVWDAIDALKGDPNINYVEPNYTYTVPETTETLIRPFSQSPIRLTPNDEFYGEQYGMELIQAPDAWSVETGNASVRVGILDTGIDYNHPELAENVDTSKTFDTVYGADGMDVHGHGTHVAGILGAKGNNTVGIAGVCWDITLVNIKIFDDYGGGDTKFLVNGLEEAKSQGLPILNLSIEGYPYNDTLESAIKDYPGLVVICAGNQYRDIDIKPNYPASFDFENTLVVGNSTSEEKNHISSNYGLKIVDIFAPGTEIYSTIPGNTYGEKTGTSMAAPHVAGTAAMLLSRNPNLTTQELKRAILDTADPIDDLSGLCVTGGRLNTYKALLYSSNYEIVNDFSELKAALDGSAEKIKIAQDITFTETLNIRKGVTFEPYGTESVTLTAASGHRHFSFGGYLNNPYTVNMEGITLHGGGINNYASVTLNGGTIKGSTSFSQGGGIWNTANLTLNGVEICDNSADEGGGMYNTSSISTVTINNSKIHGNKAKTYGGGIYNYGKLTINSVEITGNTGQYGSGIFNFVGSTTISDGEISGNTSTNCGGGIYNYRATLTIHSGIITNNSTRLWGGGIYNRDAGTMVVHGGMITNNKAEYGGGICSKGGSITIFDGEISGNTSGTGGGINIEEKTEMTIEGGKINDNTCRSAGGGVYIKSSTTTITGGEICGNTTTSGNSLGGGIGNNGGTLIIYDGKINNNKTTGGNGGGIFNTYMLTIYGGEISGNTSSIGGGIDCRGEQGEVRINGGKIHGNTAGWMGGGIRNNSRDMVINGGEISNNKSLLEGGGISNSGNLTIENGLISNNTTSDWGGGIYNGFGTLIINGGDIIENLADNNGIGVDNGTGGGIHNHGNGAALIVTGGNIMRNEARTHGGGIYNSSSESTVTINGGSNIDNTPDNTYGF